MNTHTHNDDTARPARPAPTRALRELPDIARVRALGIETLSLDEARIVLVALSLFIARGTSKTRGKVAVMASMLVAACRVEMIRDGQFEPAALPELPTTGWPQGASAFAQLGIDREQLESYWVEARNRADDACLPVDWVLAFAPAQLWPAVIALLEWGPLEAAMRVEEAVTLWARTPIRRGTRSRPEGSLLAAGTLASRVDCLWGLMQVLVDLRGKVQASRSASLPLSLLERWTFKPERVDVAACGAREARTDRSGPPIEDCRALLRTLHADWRQAMPSRRYRRLPKLLLLAILSVYGPRLDALRMLDVDDYRPDFLFQDGVRGPVLRLYPGKTRAHDEPHILPLPLELARWIEEWIAYTGRSLGEPNEPFWPSALPAPGAHAERISNGGLYGAIAGREGKNGNSTPLLARGDNPSHGYNPHSYRHTAYQGAKRAGIKAKHANPHEFAHVDPEDFARAICAHDLQQSVSDAYRDLWQQQLARAVVGYAWNDLWQGGKRHGLDPDAINRAQHEAATLAAAVDHVDQAIRSLHARQVALSKRTAKLAGDKLHAILIESNQLAAEMQIATRDLNRLGQQLDEAERRLAHALITEVPLPDELDPEEHERLLAVLLERTQQAETQRHGNGPLADELTVGDLKEIYGVSTQAINRWYRDGFPSNRPPAWDNDAWTVAGPRSKTLPVAALNHNQLSDPQRERLHVVRERRGIAQAA